MKPMWYCSEPSAEIQPMSMCVVTSISLAPLSSLAELGWSWSWNEWRRRNWQQGAIPSVRNSAVCRLKGHFSRLQRTPYEPRKTGCCFVPDRQLPGAEVDEAYLTVKARAHGLVPSLQCTGTVLASEGSRLRESHGLSIVAVGVIAAFGCIDDRERRADVHALEECGIC